MAIDSNGHPASTSPPPDAQVSAGLPAPVPATPAGPGRGHRLAQLKRLIEAIRDSDETAAQDAVIRLSQSNRLLAPAALAVGAVAMLFTGLKMLFTNWRLTLVQVLPAMWIWAAMFDIKEHVLYGRSFRILLGPVVIPVVLAVAAITAASFFLNAVFAFAIAGPGTPLIRPGFIQARSRLASILGWGGAVGVLLGVAAIVVPRWGLHWFAVSLGIVIGVMMVCYVAVPARLIGVKSTRSRRDKLTASAVGGAVGALVCTPPYVLGRVGLLMLGTHALFVPGIVIFAAGLTLQAGATGAVKAVKMSASLISGRRQSSD